MNDEIRRRRFCVCEADKKSERGNPAVLKPRGWAQDNVLIVRLGAEIDATASSEAGVEMRDGAVVSGSHQARVH